MHFLLVGATGRTGQAVLREVLGRGHTAVALVRNPDNVEARPGLTLAKGSPLSISDIETAFTATPSATFDAVLVTLNVRRSGSALWSKTVSPLNLMEASISNIAKVMKTHHIRKLVNMTAFGVGDSSRNVPWYLKLVFENTHLGAQFKDHDNAHKVVQLDDEIDWVFVRPLRLTETKKAEVKVHGNCGEGVGGLASISIASVADFMVTAAEGTTWDRETPVITN